MRVTFQGKVRGDKYQQCQGPKRVLDGEGDCDEGSEQTWQPQGPRGPLRGFHSPRRGYPTALLVHFQGSGAEGQG